MVLIDLNMSPPEEEEEDLGNIPENEGVQADENIIEEGEIMLEEENTVEGETMLEEENIAGQNAGVQQAKRTRKLLTDEEKYAAYVAMHFVCMSNGGKFKRDDKKKIAEFFGAGIQAIQRIWQKAMKQIENGLPVDVSNNRKGRCGNTTRADSRSPRTLQELIKGVLEEFEGYDSSLLNKIFLSLQCCMIEIMNHSGGNDYTPPHVNKARLERLGLLPLVLQCPSAVYANALQVLGLAVP